MLDPKESGVAMTSTHKISFSIINILDPKKFNSKRPNELSIVAEKFPAPNEEKTTLSSDGSAAGGDFRAESYEAGEKRGTFEIFIKIYPLGANLWQMRILKKPVDKKNHPHENFV